MRYLPFEDITYTTQLTPEEVVMRISQASESDDSFMLAERLSETGLKPYEGVIRGLSFKISRKTGYLNSFLPIIEGKIERKSVGTTVNVKMRLNPFGIVFLILWVGGVGFSFLIHKTMVFINQNFDPKLLIHIGVLVFGYFLVLGGFKFESIKSKKYLAHIFEAKIRKHSKN